MERLPLRIAHRLNKLGSLAARDSFLYLLSIAISGVLSVVSITVYGKYLPAAEYGKLSIVIAASVTIQSFVFEWLRVGILRFVSGTSKEAGNNYAKTIFRCYLGLALAAFVVVQAVDKVFPIVPASSQMSLATCILFVVEGWAAGILTYQRAQLRVVAYFILSVLRSAVALIVGLYLVLLEPYYQYATIGYATGASMVLVAFMSRILWTNRTGRIAGEQAIEPELKPVSTEKTAIRSLLTYGGPLVASSTIASFTILAERALLVGYRGFDAAGSYSLSYDIVQRSLVFGFLGLNMAGFPLLVRTYEQKGQEAASLQLNRQLGSMILITLPVFAWMCLLAPVIAAHAAAPAGRLDVAGLLPLVAISGYIGCINQFCVALPFHLVHQTWRAIIVSVVAICCSFLLGVILVPRLGSYGTAYASIIAQLVSLLVSVFLARQVFKFVLPTMLLPRIVLSVVAAVGITAPFVKGRTDLGFAIGVSLLFVACYALSFVLLGLMSSRWTLGPTVRND